MQDVNPSANYLASLDDDERAELLQYLYDLQGYLVVEEVLTPAQVANFNRILDETLPAFPTDRTERTQEKSLGVYDNYRFGMAGGSYRSNPGFLAYGQPFVDLLDHPLTMQIMRMQLGEAFRLDRIFGMRMLKGMPSGVLHSDYGASEPFTRAERGKFYPQPGHQALHGFAVAAFNLSDSGPDTGGTVLYSWQSQQSLQTTGMHSQRRISECGCLSESTRRERDIFH